MNTFKPCAVARPVLHSFRQHSFHLHSFHLHSFPLRPATMLCSLLLAASIHPAAAQPEPGPELAPAIGFARSTDMLRLEIPALKRAYLDCDRAATERLLSFDEATTCSHVSEALLSKAFNRDFDQLLAWWRSEKPAQAGAPRHADHPAVVVQRLRAQQGYDYAARFYPHPAWLYLLPEAPRPMADHPAVIVFRRDQAQRAALAEAATTRSALVADMPPPR